MISSSTRIKHGCFWCVIILAGVVWGAGLSKTLSQEYNIPFFYNLFDSAVFMLSGAITVVLLTLRKSRRGVHLNLIAQQFLYLYLPLIDLFAKNPESWRGTVLLVCSMILFLLSQVELREYLWIILVVSIPLFTYIQDISPYVGRADTFEFQVVSPQLGIAHPSGYPLYVLIGKLFSFIPIGTNAWRINFSSSVFAVIGICLLFITLRSLTTHLTRTQLKAHHYLVIFLSTLILAFSPTLWSRSIEAEVYTLNASIVASVLWVAVQWLIGRQRTATALPFLGFLLGCAISSHLTLAALASIVFFVGISKWKEITWKTIGASLGTGLAGLSLYMLIPLRWPVVTGETMTLSQFVRFITNADSTGALLPRAFLDDPSRWQLVFRLLMQQVGWAGLLLALVGLIVLFVRYRSLAVGTCFSFMMWVWFNLSFYVAEPDYSAFLIPGYVVLVFWLGVGAITLMGMLRRENLWLSRIALTLFAIIPAQRIWTTGPTLHTAVVGSSDENWGRYVLSLPISKNAVILADSEKFPPLYYLQQIERIRRDLTLITLFDESQYQQAMQSYLSEGKHVYLARFLPGLDVVGVSSLGPLVYVAPEDYLSLQNPTDISFGEVVTLQAFSLDQDKLGRPLHHLTLQWIAAKDVAMDLDVRLRLIQPENEHIAWESAPSRPVGGYSSTNTWRKGRIVQDYHALSWPEWLLWANYRLELGIFPRFEEQGLFVNGTEEVWVDLTTELFGNKNLPGDLRIDTPVKALYEEGIWLLGVNAQEEILQASSTEIDFLWKCPYTPQTDLSLQFFWESQDQKSAIPVTAVERSSGTLNSFPQNCGNQNVYRRYILPTPAVPGDYQLSLSMMRKNGSPVSVRCRWLTGLSTQCTIADFSVIPAMTGMANYDNVFILLDAVVETQGLSAAGPLEISLKWKGAHTVEEDYTMFVQVVGPDGRLYGQVDSWPQHGGRPTSHWTAGEQLEDHYALYLEDEMLPGNYQVIVGWYLLADMGRIPVITETGDIIGDFHTIGTFTVSSEGSVE